MDAINTSTVDVFQLLQEADDAYYNTGSSIMDDATYDQLRAAARAADPAHEYFTGIGSSVRGAKVPLPFSMGSLDQIEIGKFAGWAATIAPQDEIAVISDKLDGVSGMLVFGSTGKLQIGYSRGDGVEGSDITRHVRKIPNVPAEFSNDTDTSIAIRGEFLIPIDVFKRYQHTMLSKAGTPYKNPRNAVAGILNSTSTPDEVLAHVRFVAYEITSYRTEVDKHEQLELLALKGFEVVPFSTRRLDDIDDQWLSRHIGDRRSKSQYELDGVVVDLTRSEIRQKLGYNNINPNYAIKYKVADVSNTAHTKVVDVEINVSKDGYLKPTIVFEPVSLVGVTISRCTGFNASFILNNSIGPGAVIDITRSGDVIPFIKSVIRPMVGDSGAWFSAKLSDFGDWEWTENKVDVKLTAPHSSKQAIVGTLVDFFSTIGVEHIGEGNITLLVDVGVTSPEEVILMDVEDMSVALGSRVVAMKIKDSITKKLINIPLHKLMGAHPAFGRGVGVRKIKKMLDGTSGRWGTGVVSIEDIVAIESFDVKTATKIINGFKEFERFLTAIQSVVVIEPHVIREGVLANKSFVFTGFRSEPLEAAIVGAGGTVSTSVSKKTSYVVTNTPSSSSSKLEKARSLNIPIIAPEDVTAMLGDGA